MNPSKDSNEHRVRTLQEERRTTLEQVKSLENNITSGDIKEDEAAQLQELYIIKLKYGIFMLETNEINFLETNKSHGDLKIETRVDDIREEIEYNAKIIISF